MTAALHWVRGVTKDRTDDSVLSMLAGRLGESVVVLDHGRHGYASGYLVGPVRVYAHAERPDMGVCVEVTGEGCEELGGVGLARLVADLELRLSRVDVALDHCPFTPADLRDAWRSDQVRTRCKVPEDAREDRAWRTSDWRSNGKGDTFAMGSRASSQYARVYDSRGFTRFELEVKHALAEKIGAGLVAAVADPDSFRSQVVGLVRRFVDFVDPRTSANRSRCTLLPWWASFIDGAQKARVDTEPTVIRTVEEIEAWVEHQVAPALAVLEQALGFERLREIARAGRQRWTGRHRAALRLGSVGSVPVPA